ncbi:MAG TPA: DUF1476 domain-containing protein [Caulobacteraceae bacterium]|nr:DUF1476 domain-containing protein [Caulobacteraceae bacterium]
MTTFDDRESGFERKFAEDEALEFKALSRRNHLLGVWAGELMELEGKNLDDYAAAVVRAEVAGPGEEEVLRRVSGDLAAAGLKVSEGQVLAKMQELLAVAREQVKAGD